MSSPLGPADHPQVDFLGDALSLVLVALFLGAVFFLTDMLGWWLNPPPTASSARTWTGVAVVLAVYGLFLLVFSVWP